MRIDDMLLLLADLELGQLEIIKRAVEAEIERRPKPQVTDEELAMSPIEAIKAIRQRTGLDLLSAKNLYDKARFER